MQRPLPCTTFPGPISAVPSVVEAAVVVSGGPGPPATVPPVVVPVGAAVPVPSSVTAPVVIAVSVPVSIGRKSKVSGTEFFLKSA